MLAAHEGLTSVLTMIRIDPLASAIGKSKAEEYSAAFNNPDRAAEYLMTGILPTLPQHEYDDDTPPSPQASDAATSALPQFGQMPMQTQMPGETPPAQAPFFPGLPFVGSAGQAPPAQAPATGPLAPLKNNTRFKNRIKMIVQQSPQALNQVLSAIGKENPSMIDLIAENQDEFVEMLQEPVTHEPAAGNDALMAMLAAAAAHQQAGGGVPQAAPQAAPQAPQMPSQAATGPIRLTPAEEESVTRLQALGFERHRVVVAYLACAKNEELAANYLFDSMGDD